MDPDNTPPQPVRRDYILHGPPPSSPHDSAPPFVQRAMTWAKATNEITGLIRGLLADGVVAESEAVYLRNWLAARPELLCDPLVAALGDRLTRIFADGTVTPEELEDLKSICLEFTPEDRSAPTTLPLDDPPPVIIVPDHAFCFTGTFVSGKRSWCQQEVLARKGMAHDKVQADTDYLVVGAKVSRAWANESYGRKIEAAANRKRKGGRICITNEEHWLTAIR